MKSKTKMVSVKNDIKESINDELKEISALINGLEVREVSNKRLEELLYYLNYVKEELDIYFEIVNK